MKTSKEHNKNRNRRQSGPFIQRMNRQRHAGAAPFLSRQPPPVIQPKLQQGGAGLKRQPGHSQTGEKQDMDGACHGLSQIPYEILKARRKIILEESFSPASEPGASLENDCTNWEKHLNSIDTELNNRLKTIESESSSYFGFNLKHLALQDLLDRRAILEDIGNGEFPPLKKAQPFGNLINSIFKKPYEINLWLEIYSRKKNLAAPKSLKRSLTGDTYEFAESYEELLAAHRFLHSFAEESEKESVKIIMRDMWQNMYAGLKHNIPARLFNDKLYLLPANKKTDFGHAPNELLSIRSSPGKGGSLTTQDEQWLERLTEDQLLKYLFALEHEISQGSENQNILRYNLRMLQWEYNKRGQFYEDAILSPLGREPIAASDLAPHALGIRAQLKEMFKQDYFKRRDKNYLSAAAADAVPDEVRKALGSDAPAALDVPKYIGYVALSGLEVDLNIPENEKPIDFRVNHLKKEIEAGDRPPAEKEALIQLLEEQHALLKVEKARFLEEFETEARAELKRRLAVSKKIIENERERFKIKTEALSFKDLTESDQAKLAGALAAKRLGRPEIEAALKADVEYYKHSFSNATDPLETIGMAAGAQLLAEKRKEIEDNKEKMKNEIDLIGPKNRAIVGCLWGEGTISGSEYLLKKYHPDYQKPLEALLNAKPIIKEKEEEYLYLRAVIEKEYPILASWAAKNDREGLERISRGVSSVGEDLGMAQMLGTEIREKLQNIAVVEHRVDTDKSIIWEMGEIMAGAKQAMRVPEFSIYDFWVNDTLRRKREDKEFWDTFLSVLSISLGALAAPLTGGASLALTAAGAAVGGYETLKKLEKYQWEQTLYGTDFDPARAIIHQEPSLSWLAMDLIGLGLDVADIVKILKVAKSTKIVPARGINSESFTDLIGQLDTVTKKKVNIRIQAIDAIKDSQLKYEWSKNQLRKLREIEEKLAVLANVPVSYDELLEFVKMAKKEGYTTDEVLDQILKQVEDREAILMHQIRPGAKTQEARASEAIGSFSTKTPIDKTVGAEGRIVYRSSDLSEKAFQLRKDLEYFKGKNVAVIEYLDDNGELQIIDFALTNKSHSERILINRLEAKKINLNRVTRLYTELSPCEYFGCGPLLKRSIPNAKVTWSFDYGVPKSIERTRAKKIRAAGVEDRKVTALKEGSLERPHKELVPWPPNWPDYFDLYD